MLTHWSQLVPNKKCHQPTSEDIKQRLKETVPTHREGPDAGGTPACADAQELYRVGVRVLPRQHLPLAHRRAHPQTQQAVLPAQPERMVLVAVQRVVLLSRLNKLVIIATVTGRS